MKKHMSLSGKNKIFLRGILTVCCMAVVMLGISFTSYAQNGTVNRSNVNVRAEAGTSGAQVATVTTNDVVEILSEKMGTDGYVWYNIKTSAGVTGYVRSDFITKVVNTNPPVNNEEEDEEEEEEQEEQTPATQVTDTEDKTAYVKGTSSVNIRQDASTSSGRVASARGGSQITIVGEATGADGYKWYKVEFVGNGSNMSGFIRSDLITFEAPTQDPEITEIEGEAGNSEEPSEAPSEPSEEPSETPSEPETTGPDVSTERSQFVVMEPENLLETVPEGFTEIDFAVGDNSYTAWEKGGFYILYASVDGATPKFYLYDYVTGGYVSYADLFSVDDTVVTDEPSEEINFKLIAIICGAVAAVLLIVVIVLAYKLANAGYADDDYDYDDDDDDDYDDDDDMLSLDGDDSDIPVAPAPVKETVVTEERTVLTEDVTPEVYVAPVAADYSDEEEEEEAEVPKSSSKKEKKSFGKKFLDYFTVEVEEDDEDEYEEDDDDDDDYDDDDEIEVTSRKSSQKKKDKKASYSYVDDDDDDLNFIDL